MQIKGLTAWVSPGRSGLELANYMFVFEHFLFITTGWGVCIGSRPAAANCSFNAKWGLTRSALKKILWLFTLGFSDAPRLGARTKMHMQTQSVGGNDNFWQTLDGSNNNPFDCCSLKSRSPRVITASLKFSYLSTRTLFLNIQNQIPEAGTLFLIMSTCCCSVAQIWIIDCDRLNRGSDTASSRKCMVT